MNTRPAPTRQTPAGDPSPAVLYVASVLPTLSETFVYRELFGLQDAGITVHAASLRPPRSDIKDPRLSALARQALPVYGAGFAAGAADVLAELMLHPVRTCRTLATGLGDAVLAADVRLTARPRVLGQCLAGIALARRSRHLGLTHIHAHLAHAPTAVAMYAAMQLGVPFSFTGHANDLFPQRSLLAEKLKRATFVACISHWHRELYRSIAPLEVDRLPIVRCGVDVPPERPRAERPAGPIRLVTVARLVEKKGIDVLVRALGALRQRGLDVRADIVGGGPEQDRLTRLASELHLGDHITFHGSQEHARSLQVVDEADIFVLPCRVDTAGDRDGIPVSLMEAMARTVCVVSGDLPAIRELIEHDVGGVLVPPGDVDPLADALERLIRDPELRTRLARGGYRKVQQEFSTDRNVRRIISALKLGAAVDPVAARMVEV